MIAGRGELYAWRLSRFVDEVTVYPVSCERLANGRSDEQWLDDVLRGGARIVQLRDKESGDRRLLAKARYFRERTSEAGALFLVNDRVDIALLADADGVHVGQKDLPPEEIVRLAPEMLIGISCNSEEQARELGRREQEGRAAFSYFNIGPLFPTRTKDGLVEFIGPEAIERFSAQIAAPFTVMGGIKLEHVPQVVGRGARRIALVTALSQAPDIAAETARWVEAITMAGRENHE
ncbi:MAG: thiamine phosphate synthase [Desulfobulbus sp.]|nr:MAG: thiamine phosphate synthase [Desulfobulbus sp.]